MNDKFELDVVTNFFKHDYHDRGKQKWQGFFLSDHQVALHKRASETNHSPLLKQEPETILDILNKASVQHKQVFIQLKTRDNCSQHQVLKGQISRFNSQSVLLVNGTFINMEEIMAIEFLVGNKAE
ncbi:hypothetical protein [Lactiplantibacillus plantarum]|uniref:hypothetical protein n=1 Tax=Lactiplantibacillus plantarum TaxID=1590 RepID=UPI001BAD61EB|nr:hypothetical protein [Lactiplantibacillus plantarum]MBS0955004.1 hypothetical protein [Lactiplantibacillus plantarum]